MIKATKTSSISFEGRVTEALPRRCKEQRMRGRTVWSGDDQTEAHDVTLVWDAGVYCNRHGGGKKGGVAIWESGTMTGNHHGMSDAVDAGVTR